MMNSRRCPGLTALKMEGEKKGMFGNIFEKAMLKLVEVKEKEGAKKKLQVPRFVVLYRTRGSMFLVQTQK